MKIRFKLKMIYTDEEFDTNLYLFIHNIKAYCLKMDETFNFHPFYRVLCSPPPNSDQLYSTKRRLVKLLPTISRNEMKNFLVFLDPEGFFLFNSRPFDEQNSANVQRDNSHN